jgi:hypothetical protein
MVIVEKGNGFADQVGRFDGTDWNFNKTLRFFNKADYWELGAIYTVSVSDNTTANVFSVTAVGSENWAVNFSITRGLAKETGVLYITTDGSTASVSKVGSFLGSTGVSFSAIISSGNIVLRYTSDSSGAGGVLKIFTMRWSDASGGPGGIPSYAAGGGSTVIAAGNPGDIQFKDVGGGLAADGRFKVNAVNGAITYGSMEMAALQGPFTLLDNQVAYQTIFSFSASTYKRAIIEYNITRNGEERVGRLLVCNNGSLAGHSDDYVETNLSGPTGVSLQALYSGGNVNIQYTSTNLGTGGTFYYGVRRW